MIETTSASTTDMSDNAALPDQDALAGAAENRETTGVSATVGVSGTVDVVDAVDPTDLDEAADVAVTSDVAGTSDVADTAEGHHGQGLRSLVEARRTELLSALAGAEGGSPGGSTPVDKIEEALGALDGMLTGDLDNISSVTAAQLSQWLDTSKYLTTDPEHDRPRGDNAADSEPSLEMADGDGDTAGADATA